MIKKIVLAISILLICGCSKERPNPIVGTWALVDYTYVNIRTGKKSTGSTNVKTWTFKDSRSAYINGSTPLTYAIKGKCLIHTYINTGMVKEYQIEELSESTLKVYFPFVPGPYQDALHQWYTFTRMKE